MVGGLWNLGCKFERHGAMGILQRQQAPHSIQSDIAKSDSVRFSDDFVRHPSRLHCINHEGLEIGVPTLYMGRVRHDFDRYEHNLHIDGVICSKMLLRMVSYNYGSLWPTLYLPGIDFGMGHDVYICFSTSLGMV